MKLEKVLSITDHSTMCVQSLKLHREVTHFFYSQYLAKLSVLLLFLCNSWGPHEYAKEQESLDIRLHYREPQLNIKGLKKQWKNRGSCRFSSWAVKSDFQFHIFVATAKFQQLSLFANETAFNKSAFITFLLYNLLCFCRIDSSILSSVLMKTGSS